jgi:hypothetical protein
MRKALFPVFMAGTLVLVVSLVLLYAFIFFFPHIMEDYYNPMFRSTSFETDILFYIHPFILSISLYWFWGRFKGIFTGSLALRALGVSMAYTFIAIVPVLWLTFSAINVSILMVLTWIGYGAIQAFAAGLVMARFNP